VQSKLPEQINSWEYTHLRATSRPEHQLKSSDRGASKDKPVASVQDKYNTPDEEGSKEEKLERPPHTILDRGLYYLE
jgi:hypothetical protein